MKQFQLYFLLFAAFAVFVAGDCNDDEMPEPIDETSTLFEQSFLNTSCNDGSENTIEVITITDRGEGIGDVTLNANTTYVLNGFVFVNEGQTLNIEAGTIIKGASGQGERASALIVARGATINANGTADMPIIFTADADQIFRDGDGNLCKAGGLAPEARGLWGGLIVLGSAGLNSVPGETAVDGIPTSEPRGLFGGTNDDDNSGTLRYVSIRHGGTDIGSGNEINGLTLGGVGRGTTIEHIEVFANNDDGIEWFGGTVNTKFLAVSYCKDDGMDYDEGFRGMGQFWLVVQEGTGDSGGEHDGGTDPETAEPFAIPVIYNATYLGADPDDKRAVRLRDNAGGMYYNSVFGTYKRGFHIELLADEQDSYKQFQDGNLVFENNVFFNITGDVVSVEFDEGNAPAGVDDANAALAQYFTDKGNVNLANLDFLSRLVPAEGSEADAAGTAPVDAFFEAVDYKGAVEPGTTTPWAAWTRLAQEL